MSSIALVTDSTAYMPLEQVQQYGLHVIPVDIHIDGASYRDGVDIDAATFYRQLASAPSLPTTLQPSAGGFFVVLPAPQRGRRGYCFDPYFLWPQRDGALGPYGARHALGWEASLAGSVCSGFPDDGLWPGVAGIGRRASCRRRYVSCAGGPKGGGSRLAATFHLRCGHTRVLAQRWPCRWRRCTGEVDAASQAHSVSQLGAH